MDYTQNNRKVPVEDEDRIVTAFTVNLERIMDIAKQYGVTRQAIYKLLRRRGVDTTKTGSNSNLIVTCANCGAPVIRKRYHVRKFFHLFCGEGCRCEWYARNATHQYNRAGCYQAHKVVALVYDVPDGAVIHHIDGNGKNNVIENLMVFSGNGDHVRWHRGLPATPLFDGREHKEEWERANKED